MKKELFALLLLLLLMAGAFWNIQYLSVFTGELLAYVEDSARAARADDWRLSQEKAANAAERWQGADKYTHIFIRHTEIDSINTDFFQLLGAITRQDKGDFHSAYLSLCSRISGVYRMERLAFGSIF